MWITRTAFLFLAKSEFLNDANVGTVWHFGWPEEPFRDLHLCSIRFYYILLLSVSPSYIFSEYLGR